VRVGFATSFYYEGRVIDTIYESSNMLYISYMERTVEAPNIAGLLKKEHLNKWVAFTPDYKKVLASGKDLNELLEKTGKEDFAVVQVSENGYVGSIL